MEAFLKLQENLYVLDIPKNGSTLIKALISGSKGDNEDIHNKSIGYIIDNVHTFDSSSFKLPGTKVAIYRNPIDRFVSVYTDKVLNPNPKTSLCNVLKEHRIRTLQNLIDYVRNYNGAWDRHLKPQYLFLEQSVPVDYIVKLEDLNDWILKYTEYTPFLANASKVSYTPSKREVEQIKELYKEDFNILNNHRVWEKK